LKIDKFTGLVVQDNVDTDVLDGVGRLAMDTIGSGRALVMRNGYKLEGKWQKDSRKGRTKFFDDTNNEISLNPGKIWIAVMNRVNGVEYN